MKKLLLVMMLCKAFSSLAQTGAAPTIRSVLLEQLKTTWQSFRGTTGKPSDLLECPATGKFQRRKPGVFSGNNKETLANKLDDAGWTAAIRQLDDILTQLETIISLASEAKLQTWYATLANISTHNAYHPGQIIFVRKQHGSWDPEKGVK